MTAKSGGTAAPKGRSIWQV